jgi:hypothetical protein
MSRLVLALVVLGMFGCGRREESVCTQYFERYASCVAKMGPEARAAAEANLKRERERVRALEREGGATRGAATAACQASLQAIASTCR